MKRKLKNREQLFGAWTSWGHPQITEAFASIMQPDFIGIDIEHSTISQGEAREVIAAGQAKGVPVLPRIAWHNPEAIKRFLDSGADGIIVPMVNTKEELDKLIRWSKYPPLGARSYGIARAQSYGADFENYTKTWNDRSVLMIQIESVQGIDNLDQLLDTEHVDGVMIGPYDISGSLGIPGKLTDPKVLKACDRVIEACAKYKKSCGTQVADPDENNVKQAIDNGYTFVVLASDVFLLWKWSEKMNRLMNNVRSNF